MIENTEFVIGRYDGNYYLATLGKNNKFELLYKLTEKFYDGFDVIERYGNNKDNGIFIKKQKYSFDSTTNYIEKVEYLFLEIER